MREQLELKWTGRRGCKPLWKNQRRRARAHWWFEQMGRVVDGARDWKPALHELGPPIDPVQKN